MTARTIGCGLWYWLSTALLAAGVIGLRGSPVPLLLELELPPPTPPALPENFDLREGLSARRVYRGGRGICSSADGHSPLEAFSGLGAGRLQPRFWLFEFCLVPQPIFGQLAHTKPLGPKAISV